MNSLYSIFIVVASAAVSTLAGVCPGPTLQGLSPVSFCVSSSCPSQTYCYRNTYYSTTSAYCCPNYDYYTKNIPNNDAYNAGNYNNQRGSNQNNANTYTPSRIVNTNNIRDTVEREISRNPVLIIGRSTCAYCQRAKNLMKQYDGRFAYNVIEYDYMPNGNELIRYVVGRTGQNTVPQVFVCGRFIGGSSQLQSLANSGQLQSQATRCNRNRSSQPSSPLAKTTVSPTNNPNAIRLEFPAGITTAESVVTSQIANNGVLLYTRSTCSFCKKSRALLDIHYPNLVYHFFEIDTTLNGIGLMRDVISRTGWDTVPQIFVCGQFLGGSDKLETMHLNGQLRGVLERCIRNTVYGSRQVLANRRRRNFFRI